MHFGKQNKRFTCNHKSTDGILHKDDVVDTDIKV
jgi:hypothetical protein